MVEVSDRTEAKILVSENTNDDGEELPSNCTAMLQKFVEHGCSAQFVAYNTGEFALPQHRLRAYTLALHGARLGITRAEADLAVAIWERCVLVIKEQMAEVTEWVHFEDFLVDEHHPEVQAAAQGLFCKKEQTEQADESVAKKPRRDWVSLHMTFFDERKIKWVDPVLHDLGWGDCGYDPEEEANNIWNITLSGREKHCLLAMSVLYPAPTATAPEQTLDLGTAFLE